MVRIPGKICFGIFLKLLLPDSILFWMNLVFDTELLDGLTFFESLKDNFGLKGSSKFSSFSFHSQQSNILLFCCPIFLDHHTCWAWTNLLDTISKNIERMAPAIFHFMQ